MKNGTNDPLQPGSSTTSEFGVRGVTTVTFLLVVLAKEIYSWLYSVYIWIFRRARFPTDQYRLWIVTLVSEVIYGVGQGTMIFYIAPYVSDGGTEQSAPFV